MLTRILCALFFAAVGCGCGSRGSDLMPLEVGKSWLYQVEVPIAFETYIDPIKVTRTISVANTEGVELSGSLGTSRIAWSGNTLVAERLIGTQLTPPMPLLYNAEETHERPWKGQLFFGDRTVAQGSPASAVQSQAPDDTIVFGGRKVHCIRSTVVLRTQRQEIELTTWFSPGLGIVQQDQRTDKILFVRLRLLDVK